MKITKIKVAEKLLRIAEELSGQDLEELAHEVSHDLESTLQITSKYHGSEIESIPSKDRVDLQTWGRYGIVSIVFRKSDNNIIAQLKWHWPETNEKLVGDKTEVSKKILAKVNELIEEGKENASSQTR